MIRLIAVVAAFVIMLEAKEYARVQAGAEYNYWLPMGIEAIEVQTYGYNVAYMELSISKIEELPYLPSIPSLRYESNFDTRYQDEILAVKKDSNLFEKFEYLLGILDFHLFAIKYEKEVFVSEVTAKHGFLYRSNSGSSAIKQGERLNFTTGFETYSIGQYSDEYGFAGFFYSRYAKPYFKTPILISSAISPKF